MASQAKPIIKGQIKIDTLLAFAFGIIFVSAILFFAVTVVNPSPFQINTFKTVLALAAGGVAAVIPGQFEIKHLPIVRAGGGLGVFAAVFFAPASVVTPVTQLKAPDQSPDPVIASWFTAVDSGNYAAAWRQADTATAQWYNLSEANFIEIFKNVRSPLGALQWRRVVSRGDLSNPPNFPPGLYRSIAYMSKFANSAQCVQESIGLRATDDLQWKVFTHQISYVQIPCLAQPVEQPKQPTPAATPPLSGE